MAVHGGAAQWWTTGTEEGRTHLAKRAKVQSDIILNLDSSVKESYPGSGETWFDLANNYNATLVNGPTFSETYGGGFTLDGSNDHFTLPSGFSDFSNGFTVSAFVNFGGANSWERIIDFGNGSPSDNIIFARNSTSNTLSFAIYNNTTSRGTCSVTNGVLNNTIAQYAATLNGTNCVIYRNGAVLQSFSYAFLPTNITRNNNYIGRSNWVADGYFQTNIYSVSIYSRALSNLEIRRNFNSQRRRFGL